MKREELKELGLEDAQIESILAMHGKTVTPLNEKISTLTASETDLKGQIAKYDKDLKKLQKDNEDNEDLKETIKTLQKEHADAQKEYESRLTKVQSDSALEKALVASKAKNTKAISALLDHDLIKFENGELFGVNEQLEKLKESDSYLFDLGKTTSGYTPPNGQESKNYSSFEEAMKNNDIEGYLQNEINSKGE